jgi:hypothetical protein
MDTDTDMAITRQQLKYHHHHRHVINSITIVVEV